MEILKRTHGTGVIVINSEGTHIFVINEIGSNPLSSRVDGMPSIPLETAKINHFGFRERQRLTLLGVMAEVVDDKLIETLRRDFHRLRFSKNKITLGENKNINAKVEIVVFSGDISDYQVKPIAGDEVSNPRWVNIDYFLTDTNSRAWAKETLLFARNNNYLEPENLNKARNLIFPHRISLNRIYHRRERLEDMDLKPYTIFPRRKS